MYKFFSFILIIFISGCSSSYKKTAKGYEKDGIIFLYEEEKTTNSASPQSKPTSLEKTNGQENQDDVRDFTKLDGITYLNSDEQAMERPNKPLQMKPKLESGKASYYAMSLTGNKTASGERYDPDKLTAAHPSLPFGTKVRVTNIYNRKSVTVRINDRGPHTKSRIIDLSFAAAQQLDMVSAGIIEVVIEVVKE